ncbi:MAG: serine/threonine protein kinase [Sandaracinus sp.]|nr:serine/threonine protein kinase [Sandaracinus sp.]
MADRYRVVHWLAQGGMGRVYFAEDVRLERPVVLKVGVGSEAPYLRREARVLASLDHVTIPPVFDLGEIGSDGAFLVLPWIDGETLRDSVRRAGPWGALDAVEVALELAQALASVHARGVFHCDLKPSNVILRRDAGPSRRVALVDFGVADNLEPPITRLARTGKLLGTPCFLAPENLQGSPPTPRTDVYGLGACLYFLLSGAPPVEPRDDLGQLLLAVLEGRVVPLRARRPSVATEVHELVHRALAPDPRVRFDDATDFAEALRKARHRLRLTQGTGHGGFSPS